ncbi:MAG: dimethylsulfonioproprionate lyase family protein [Actinomycetota bacterium]
MADLVDLLCAEIAASLRRAYVEAADSRLLVGAERIEALAGGTVLGVTPTRFPVVDRWLGPACDLAPERTRRVAQLIAETADQFCWRRSYPNDADDPVIAHMRQGYAYALVAAPPTTNYGSAPIGSDDVLVAVSIQAPGLLYPRHHHPAVEMYGPVAGQAIWLNGTDRWYHRQPGNVVIHTEHEEHAIATGHEPLLNYVVWTSNLDGRSRLTSAAA